MVSLVCSRMIPSFCPVLDFETTYSSPMRLGFPFPVMVFLLGEEDGEDGEEEEDFFFFFFGGLMLCRRVLKCRMQGLWRRRRCKRYQDIRARMLMRTRAHTVPIIRPVWRRVFGAGGAEGSVDVDVGAESRIVEIFVIVVIKGVCVNVGLSGVQGDCAEAEVLERCMVAVTVVVLVPIVPGNMPPLMGKENEDIITAAVASTTLVVDRMRVAV